MLKRKASSYETVMGLNGCVPQANRAITTSFLCVCLKRLLPCTVVARQEADDVLYWKDSLVRNIAHGDKHLWHYLLFEVESHCALFKWVLALIVCLLK